MTTTINPESEAATTVVAEDEVFEYVPAVRNADYFREMQRWDRSIRCEGALREIAVNPQMRFALHLCPWGLENAVLFFARWTDLQLLDQIVLSGIAPRDEDFEHAVVCEFERVRCKSCRQSFNVLASKKLAYFRAGDSLHARKQEIARKHSHPCPNCGDGLGATALHVFGGVLSRLLSNPVTGFSGRGILAG
ncbi:MAG: hypothetical protein NUW37_10135 [Planctomycetes bacterium]|nr:hypothetical protein [Planctomycetota bacterium]